MTTFHVSAKIPKVAIKDLSTFGVGDCFMLPDDVTSSTPPVYVISAIANESVWCMVVSSTMPNWVPTELPLSTSVVLVESVSIDVVAARMA